MCRAGLKIVILKFCERSKKWLWPLKPPPCLRKAYKKQNEDKIATFSSSFSNNFPFFALFHLAFVIIPLFFMLTCLLAMNLNAKIIFCSVFISFFVFTWTNFAFILSLLDAMMCVRGVWDIHLEKLEIKIVLEFFWRNFNENFEGFLMKVSK